MIQELGKNKYKLIVNISENGKRIARKTKTVNCGKREANKLYTEFEAEVRKNISSSTIDKMLDNYLKVRSRSCEPTTMAGYNTCRDRIIAFLGGRTASKVKPIDIEDFVAHMGNKYSAKTIKNTMSLLSATYEWAIDIGQLEANPCKKIKKPQVTSKEPMTYTVDEVKKFTQGIADAELDIKVAIELALFCGLRRSEICGLKPSDYEDGCLHIRRTRHIVSKTGESIQKTKSIRSNRILSLPEFVAKDVEELILKHQNAEYKTEDWLILNVDEPINPSTLYTRIARIQNELGLPVIGIHALRHTFATLLLNSQAVDIAQLSRELGHSQISTTLNIYSHASGGASASSRLISATLENIFEQNTTFHTTQE